MDDKLVPKPQKENKHSSFVKYWYIFSSAVCSFWFITTLFFLAIFYHIRKSFGKNAVGKIPLDTDNNECYPDVKSMKISSNLRYYALQLGLDLLEYKVQTKDGYVLILHRLIDPNHSDEFRNQMPPILCQHGLLSSSGSYLTPGNKSLAVYFLNQGYDVWLGNNRSGFEPLHAFESGNLMHSELYWDWDIKDLAYYDMPCLIEQVLVHKPTYNKLTLVGHLQGCTQSFLMLMNSELAQIHNKVEAFIGLAPAIYPGVLFHKRKFLRFMSLSNNILFQMFFGICCFLNNLTQARNYLYGLDLFGKLCVIMFNYLFEWNAFKWNSNPKVWHFHFVFSVSYVSSKLMTWWVCHWRQDSFRNELCSKKTYTRKLNDKVVKEEKFNANDEHTFFPYKMSWFSADETKTIVPMIIFNGETDNLVDGGRLSTHMKTFEPGYVVGDNLWIYNVPGYSHLDVVWANDVIESIGEKALKIMRS